MTCQAECRCAREDLVRVRLFDVESSIQAVMAKAFRGELSYCRRAAAFASYDAVEHSPDALREPEL